VLESVPEFGARVRGQLSGLDVVLEVEAPLSEATRAKLPGALSELAARHGADVIAWLGEAPNDADAGSTPGMAIHLWIAGRAQLYSRPIGPARSSRAPRRSAGDENHSSTLDAAAVSVSDEQSATLETAALAVRGAVRAVLFERTGARSSANDVPLELESPRAPAASEASAATSRRAPPPPGLEDGGESARPTALPAKSLAWAPRAGLDWSYAGLSRAGRWSLAAGFALRRDRFSGGVGGSWSFPEIVQYESVELSLRRQTLVAEVGWNTLQLPRFSLRPTLRAGAAWLSRSSSTNASDRRVTAEQRSVSALVGVQLIAEYELTRALRSSVSFGLDWLSHVPRYLIDVPPNQPIPVLEAWRWQPNAGIALGAVF
jgi:hypothetical protein